MANCVICNKTLVGKRGGAKTCSGNCRSKAYYQRKSKERKWKDCHLDLFDEQDVKTIGSISWMAGEFIIRTANTNGRDAARELIDVMCDLLSNAGVNWQNG